MLLLDAFSPQYNVFYYGSQNSIVNALMKSDESNTDAMLVMVGEMVPACKDAALAKSKILDDKFKQISAQYGKGVPELGRRA